MSTKPVTYHPARPLAFRMEGGPSLLCPACYHHPHTPDEERATCAAMIERSCQWDHARCFSCDAPVDPAIPLDCDGETCACAIERERERREDAADRHYEEMRDDGISSVRTWGL